MNKGAVESKMVDNGAAATGRSPKPTRRAGVKQGAMNISGAMNIFVLVMILLASCRPMAEAAAEVASTERAQQQQKQQEVLPKPNCSAPSDAVLNDTCGPDCWSTYINPSEMFKYCGDYSRNLSSGASPSPACCEGVRNASAYFPPRCFCHYVYQPAPNLGIIPARRLALPELCNVANFCQMCTSLKLPATCNTNPPASGKLKHHAVVVIVTLTITALVVGIIAGAISLYIWFAHRYKNKVPHLRFPNSTQPNADDMLKIEVPQRR